MSKMRSWGWGIVDSDGHPVFNECCCGPTPDTIVDVYPEDGQQLVELFYRLPAEEPSEEQCPDGDCAASQCLCPRHLPELYGRPAEEPRKVAVAAPAPERLSPLPLQREPDWWCCGADYDEHEPTCRNYKPEPAPAPADTGVTGYDRELAAQMHPTPAQRWRCEGCGAEMSADEVSRWFHGRGYWGHGKSGCGPCGPCRPVVEAGS